MLAVIMRWFTFTVSFNHYKSVREVLLFPFYRWGNRLSGWVGYHRPRGDQSDASSALRGVQQTPRLRPRSSLPTGSKGKSHDGNDILGARHAVL